MSVTTAAAPVAPEAGLLPKGAIAVTELPKLLPPRGRGRHAKPLSYPSIWRWFTAGLIGVSGHKVKLQVVRAGRVPYTSRAWVQKFFEDLADPNYSPADQSKPSPAERQKRKEAAGARLDRSPIHK